MKTNNKNRCILNLLWMFLLVVGVGALCICASEAIAADENVSDASVKYYGFNPFDLSVNRSDATRTVRSSESGMVTNQFVQTVGTMQAGSQTTHNATASSGVIPRPWIKIPYKPTLRSPCVPNW